MRNVTQKGRDMKPEGWLIPNHLEVVTQDDDTVIVGVQLLDQKGYPFSVKIRILKNSLAHILYKEEELIDATT